MMSLRPMTGELWRHRDFRTFWSAQAVSEFGDRITELAVPLIAVTVIDVSTAEAGLVTAAVWLPNVLALLIGAWVDQHPHKRALMIAADLFRAVVVLSLPLAILAGNITLIQLYAVALLAGTAHVVFTTAYQPFFVRLVTREQYLEANSKLSSTRSISYIAGPALGGLLIQWLTAPIAVVVDSLSFIFSAGQIWRTKVVVPDTSEGKATESLLRRAKSGMSYLLTNPYLKAELGCATTVNFFNFIGSALLILFASRNLHLSAGGIGLAFGIGAVGGLVGALIATPLTQRFGIGPVVAAASVVFPAAIAIVALAAGPPWLRFLAVVVGEFVASLAVMCFDVPLNSLMATVTPDQMRSRVTGAFMSINYGIRPLGAVVGGALGTWIGVRETLLISAGGGALSVLWLIRSPIIRVHQLDTLPEPVQPIR